MNHFPRTLFVTNYINRGGTSRVTMDLVRFLKNRGQEVALALTTRGAHAVHGSTTTFPTFVFDLPIQIPGTRRLQNVFVMALRKAWYRRVLREFDPEVVFCVALDEQIFDLNKDLTIPCVEHVHAIYLDTLKRSLSYLRKLASFADDYITSSEATAERLRNNLGISRERVTALYNGVPFDRIQKSVMADRDTLRRNLGFREDEVVVAGCGAVNFVKGTDQFLRVADAVRRSGDHEVPWRFIWIGEKHEAASPFWDGCQQLAAKLELDNLVEFVGYAENPLPFFAASDLFALTSHEESLPLAMMEAMALGKPVVAFPVGGVHEALSHGGGVVTRGHDPGEMGEIIASLIEDRDRRRDIGVQAQRTIQRHFDSEQLFVHFEDFLKNIAKSHETGDRTAVSGRV